jgi:soluble lytic murein transglycosylase-like protein
LFTLQKITASIFAAILFFALGFHSESTWAGTVYTYKDSKGHTFITNRPPKGNEYRLIKKVTYKPYRDRSSRVTNYFFEKPKTSEYDTLITNLSSEYKVDPALIKAVVHIESAFQNKAVSRAGAMGLMQLMPRTAASYNLTEDHFEPKANLTAGIRHLKYLLKRYKGDKKLSLAAYNAGETAVSRHNGIPPFKETQNYVVKVLSLYGKYSHSFKG